MRRRERQPFPTRRGSDFCKVGRVSGRWLDANENGAELCVTLCVTRAGKKGQIPDYL